MSDSSDQHESSDECLYPMVCTYHAVQNAKVRAIKVDGEVYINATDAAHWLKVVREFEGSQMVREAEATPPALRSHVMAATMNHNQGMLHSEARVEQMASEEILPMADARGLLVDPNEITVPDAIPASWQSQEH